MKDKKYSLYIAVIALIGLVGASCSSASENYLPATSTSLPTNEFTITPSTFPTLTPISTFTMLPSRTVVPPTPTTYPTASMVKANAIAFVSHDEQFRYSLWIANVDGSGEKKLTDIIRKDSLESVLLQWSPNGQWISYRSDDDIYVISRDGLVNKRILSLPDKSVGYLIRYAWSPDSSKIAYLETLYDRSTATPTPGPESGIAPYLVGMIDIATGNVSELSSFEANAGIPILLWSPDGRDLLFIKDYSLVLLEVATRKIVKTIKRGCGLERGLSWSPNGKWFSYTDNGVGGFTPTWICVNSVTGNPIQTIRVDSTSFNPVWDKTGNYLYFLASKIDLTRESDPVMDERLMRYDARTQETESLLSLELHQPNSYAWSLSISPDGNTLMLQSEVSQTKLDLIFVDIQSLTTTKSSVDFGTLPNDSYPVITTCGWSPDGKDIIFFFTKLYWINNKYGLFDYGYFYSLNIRTGKNSIFSGIHPAENVQISPTIIP